jgi:hypothetical protein
VIVLLENGKIMMLRHIPFRVKWIKDEDFIDGEDPLNIEDESDTQDGVCYWREDVIIGFNSGPNKYETYLIIGLDEDGKRQQFKVHESPEQVARKLNGQG